MTEFAAEERIRSLEAAVSQYEFKTTCVQRELKRLQRRLNSLNFSRSFFTLATAIRRLIDQTVVWRPGAVLIVSTVIGGWGFVLFGSPVIGIFGGILALVTMVLLVLVQSDENSIASIGKINSEQAELRSKSAEHAKLLREMEAAWKTTADKLQAERLALERVQLAASHEHRRRVLLSEDWKGLRSVEFEKYLERVFIELGYSVETTRVTGDQGVDLLVGHRGKRIAIQWNHH